MSPIQVGFNGRFFPNNWRSAEHEIAFGYRNKLKCIQFRGTAEGLDKAGLGASFAATAKHLKGAGITATMEMLIFNLDKTGTTENGTTPMDVLNANLPAILALPITHVHWHLVPADPSDTSELAVNLIPQFEEAVALATHHGFKFGFEHNAPVPPSTLYCTPESCAALLEAVPNLYFVWDFNHTLPEHIAGFKALIPRMSHLHLADAPLPEVNWHVPIGKGSVDYADFIQALVDGGFQGPAILEIGGTPWSGGFDQDTDKALVDSAELINAAIATALAAKSA